MRDHKNLRKGRQNLKPNLFLKQDDLHVIVIAWTIKCYDNFHINILFIVLETTSVNKCPSVVFWMWIWASANPVESNI